MKKTYLKSLKVFLTLLLLCGVSNAWGANYTELFTIKSGDVVSKSDYQKYTRGFDEANNIPSFIITFGGNNKSVGTNSSNRSNCNLSNYSKYAVSPVTTSDVASAFVSTTSISDIAKISYTFNGGSNQTNTNVYLIYSSDGNTFSQLSLTSGTQGATISSGTAYEFSKCSGYFGLLFKATNTSGNWRIDDVNITFYKEAEAGNSFDVNVDSEIENGTLTVSPDKNVPAGTTVTVTPSPNLGYTIDEILAMGSTSGDDVELSETKGVYTFEMPSENVDITATFKELPKHTVTLVQTEGVSLTINGGTDAVELYEGEKVNISYSDLQRGYQWGKWTVEGEGSKVTTPGAKNTTFTMGTEDATLSAQVDKLPIYNVTFIDKGAVYATKQVYKTETFAVAIDGVTNPTNDDINFADYSFKGWSTNQDVDNLNIIDNTFIINANTELFAVYGKGGVGASYRKVITEPSDWSGNYLIVYNDTKAFNGVDATGGYFEVSPNKDVISTLPTGGVTVTIASMEDGYSLKLNGGTNDKKYISGKSGSNTINYTDNAVTNSISISDGAVTISSNTSTFLFNSTSSSGDRFRYYKSTTTIGSNYTLPQLYKEEGGSAGEYSLEGSLVQLATMTSTGYATFSSDCALDLSNLPEGLTAYKATTADNGKVHMVAVEGVVAENTGLFLKGTENATYTIPVAASGNALEGNLLKATTGESLAKDDYVYVISSGAFQPLANNTVVSKGKAYIPASAITTSGKLEISFGESTGITSYENDNDNENIYNLNGVRVNGNYKGIVIMNGKKYNNK